MAHHGPFRHSRNKTSLGSITYADLANTFARPAPGLPPMLPQQATTMAQQQRHQHSHDKIQETFRRMSSVPTDREIPDGVDDMVIGDVVPRYKALRDVERRLDAVMINKRLAVRDSGQRYERRRRTLRVWISAKTVDKEGGDTRMDDTFEFNEDVAGGSYKMRIEGRILPDPTSDDDEDDEMEDVEPGKGTTMDLDKPDAAATDSKLTATKKTSDTQKFSHYFKQITIAFQPPRHALPNAPAPPTLEWKKPDRQSDNSRPMTPDANFDALEFERKLDDSVQKVIITLHRDETGGRVRAKLSEPLAKLLDREYEDQSGAMLGLYNYVRSHGLEEEGNPKVFRCDDALRAVSSIHMPISLSTQKTTAPER